MNIKKLVWEDQTENRGELWAQCGSFKASIMLPILQGPVTLDCECGSGPGRYYRDTFSDVQKAKKMAQFLLERYVHRILDQYCDDCREK